MALAAPPDLSDTAVPVQPLARTYPRGLYIEPREHVWGQVLYAMSGVMWLETPHEALVVPPRRWKAPCSPSKSGACCVRQHAENAGASVRTLARLFQAALGMGFAEWRRQVQLATAVAELIQGVPISTIARDLGYSPSSFSDMFRRELGMSPSQYPVGEGAA